MRTIRLALIALTIAALAGSAGTAFAQDFGDLGIGTQVLVVNGDQGSQTSVGLNLRARFLWVFGVDFSAANNFSEAEEAFGSNPFRANLLLHAINTDHFGLYLAPGLAGNSIGDTFNPMGESTWYRLGGGIEFRYEHVAIGGELHWAVPGEQQMNRHLDDNAEALAAQYLTQIGLDAKDASLNDITANMSPMEMLDAFDLDRVEISVGIRYYF